MAFVLELGPQHVLGQVRGQPFAFGLGLRESSGLGVDLGVDLGFERSELRQAL